MSGIFVLSAVFFFLVEGFCSEEDKQPYPPLSLQRESPKGKVKTDVFIHSHVEAFGLLLLTLVHWVFVLIYIYLYIFNQISRNCTLREEYRDIWLQKREKKNKHKINQNSIMGCPLLRNVFAALILVLLSKGKFLMSYFIDVLTVLCCCASTHASFIF